MASLLYGSGMCLMEVVRLRIKDVDFDCRQILIRNAKGAKDRVVPLPESLAAAAPCAPTRCLIGGTITSVHSTAEHVRR
jgi:site-specific recombinase XerC